MCFLFSFSLYIVVSLIKFIQIFSSRVAQNMILWTPVKEVNVDKVFSGVEFDLRFESVNKILEEINIVHIPERFTKLSKTIWKMKY